MTEHPSGAELITVVLMRLMKEAEYTGGVGGTCYECPFATAPLRYDGSEASYAEYCNDPTEAYFRCRLPGRDSNKVAWGEYAPCTRQEWLQAALAAHS